MKNNDLNYIKSKLNNSVNAPSDINKAFVLAQLDKKEQKIVKMPKKKPIAQIVSAVACLAVFAITMTTIIMLKTTNTPAVIEAEANVKAFSDYGEISETLNAIQKRQDNGLFDRFNYGIAKESIKSDDVAEENTNDISSSYAQTYKQVDAVDEADIVKTDGKYIYYLNSSQLFIYPANDNPEVISTIVFGDDYGENSYDPYDMYIYNNLLIVNAISYYSYNETKTFIYDLSNIENPKEISSYSQAGQYSSSRMIGSNLYVVSNQWAYNKKTVPYTVCDGKKSNLEAKDIYCIDDPNDSSFLVISKINVEDSSSSTQTKAILGASSDVYCNESNMYVTSAISNINMLKSIYDNYYDHLKTQIIKINLEDSIDFVASTTLLGYINDQYSMDEYNGNLRVAITSTNKKGTDTNDLYILDDKLNEIGSVKGFADNESIKAVKFVDEMAYVITYEAIDPLFTIDLSNPSNPIILGEVKIDGFSSMLVPIDEKTILGIGYSTTDYDLDGFEAADGVKLVIFDVSNKATPKISDTFTIPSSYSAVQNNQKALVRNIERNNFTIPINRTDTNSWTNASGFITFKIENGKIIIEDDYKVQTNEDCYRCTYVKNNVYTLDYNGNIKAIPYKN